MIEQLGKQQYSAVSTLTEAINHQLGTRIQVLERVGEDMPPEMLAQPDKAQAYLGSQSAVQALFSASVRVIRPDGSVVASVPLSPECLATNYADRDYLLGVLRTGKPTIGRPVMGKTLKRPLMTIAVPLRDAQGRVVGVLTGSIEISGSSFLDKIVSSPYGRSGGYVLIDPASGLFVTATDPTRIMQPVATGLEGLQQRRRKPPPLHLQRPIAAAHPGLGNHFHGIHPRVQEADQGLGNEVGDLAAPR